MALDTNSTHNTNADYAKEIAQRRKAMAAGLRRLADAVEQGAFPVKMFSGVQYAVFDSVTDEELKLTPKQAAKALKGMAVDGKVKKEVNDSYYALKAGLGGGVEVGYYYSRDDVCERRQVGEKTIKEVVAVETKEVEKTVPVYEWECPQILGE